MWCFAAGTKTYVLRAAGVEVLENDACREIHDDNADLITSANICAGGLGKDACQVSLYPAARWRQHLRRRARQGRVPGESVPRR